MPGKRLHFVWLSCNLSCMCLMVVLVGLVGVRREWSPEHLIEGSVPGDDDRTLVRHQARAAR